MNIYNYIVLFSFKASFIVQMCTAPLSHLKKSQAFVWYEDSYFRSNSIGLVIFVSIALVHSKKPNKRKYYVFFFPRNAW
jgi:hypothetical protein